MGNFNYCKLFRVAFLCFTVEQVTSMPPIRVKSGEKAKLFEKEFPKEFKVNPKEELFCLLCCTTVSCEKRFRVEQHRASSKHTKKLTGISSKTKTKIQNFMPVQKQDFRAQLVEAFMAADIL